MLTLNPPKNSNYAAKVVALGNVYPLENCSNICGTMIFGSQVIVSRDQKPGDIGLYFPVETALSKEFLANNNLYRKPEYGNVDSAAKGGLFEPHGRVRCVKMRGHKSEGFWIPISSIYYICHPLSNNGYIPLGKLEKLESNPFEINQEFDCIIRDGKEHPICHKYIPKRNPGMLAKNNPRIKKLIDDVKHGQFSFHYDTSNLRRNADRIKPEHYISITDKWHGTSAVFANVLVNRKLGWLDRLSKYLGVKVEENEYQLVYSSRTVVKGIGDREKIDTGFYGQNVWATVAREIKGSIPPGYTVYGEIVGWTPDGAPIQKGYHYGCAVGEHKFVVYRVTVTNVDGRVQELAWPQVQEFCKKQGLKVVPTYWQGHAVGYAIEYKRLTHQESMAEFADNFVKDLELYYIRDQTCPYNNYEVPAEGIVLRIDHGDTCEAYKLKNFSFLSLETTNLDSDIIDIETNESIESEETNIGETSPGTTSSKNLD